VADDFAEGTAKTFAFGPFVFTPERQTLLHYDSPVRIGNRALDLLQALVERPGDVIDKRDLIARVWPKLTVDEGNLKVNMAALRRALGEGPGAARYIATVTGRGYRFVAPLKVGGLQEPSFGTVKANHNLPIATTTVFGRAEAIERIRSDLGDSRLVSVVGTGGIGKTTVALAAAELLLPGFKDGVWIVDLSLLKDGTLLPNAIATVLGVGANTADMLTAICDFLHDRQVLLILDSCEHIIDAAAACAKRLLADAPHVRILVTSREPLMLSGERLRRLPGLEMPGAADRLNAEEALAFPAIQLFVDRATDRLESFQFGDPDVPVVANICRRLDGLALAIEFAATRIDVFALSTLLEQLDARLRFLGGRRAGPPRHHTLTATLDWSYGLLAPREARLLCSLSVFAGAFDIAGASAVASVTPTEATVTVAELVAKSLITAEVGDDVGYRLLETTRAYCLEKLRSSSDEQIVRHRHAEHVCAMLERATSEWAAQPASKWAESYGRYLDDLRGALAWTAQGLSDRSLRIRLTVAGLLLWNHFSLTEECRVHVSRAIEDLEGASLLGTPSEMHLRVWLGASSMFTHGLQPLAMDALQRALEIAEQTGDTGGRMRCLRAIGMYQHLSGQHVAGLNTLETFTSLVARTDSPNAPEIGHHLSISEFFLGRFPSARERLESVIRQSQDAGRQNVRYLSNVNIDIACILMLLEWLMGSPEAAISTAKATVERALMSNHHMSLSNALNSACPAFYWAGRYDDCSGAVAMLEEEGRRNSILTRRPIAMFYKAALVCARSGPSEGIELLECAIAEFRAINHMARMPYYLGVLAETQLQCGLLDKARANSKQALDLARANSEGWCLPEVQRMRASILFADGEKQEAQSLLLEAMAEAQKRGALSWQLRAATDLASSWERESRREDAFQLLSPIYSKFSEGFETPDMSAARRLLDSLARKTNGGSPHQ
jgi:predicted ATPase/DNA-binding winged helix-turn-helix (wHTH) protein